MTDRIDRDGAEEREELLEELEENHERSKREAANPERVEPRERDAKTERETKKKIPVTSPTTVSTATIASVLNGGLWA